MENEAPSWADQWGAGGIGAIVEDIDANKQETKTGNNKKGDPKAGGLKAKSAAIIGAQKIKSGASNGIKWIKDKFQRKRSPQ